MSCFKELKLLSCRTCKQNFSLLEENFPSDLFSLLLQNDLPQIRWLCKSCNISKEETSKDIEKLNSRVTELETIVSDIQRSLSNIEQDVKCMSRNTYKKKCQIFFSTLLRLADTQQAAVSKSVRNLIQGIMDDKMQIEEFDAKLQKELNSAPQPYLVPFLKKNLPDLRHSLTTKELTIVGVRPPSPGTMTLPHPAHLQQEQTDPDVNSQDSQQDADKKSTIIMSFTSSNTPKIELHKSENPWRPRNKLSLTDIAQEDLDREKLKRRVQGVLNKLTPRKFETLLMQLKGLNIDTEEKLHIVTDFIYERAINEPLFIVAYANLCKHLSLIKVSLVNGRQVNFRKVLLALCQNEFEQYSCDELKHEDRMKTLEETELDKRNKMKLEFDLEHRNIRDRQLGMMRFIGELYKLNMLIEPIVHECIKKLLSQGDEMSVECLSELLRSAGKALEETRSGKSRKDSPMDMYFAQIQSYVSKRLTSYRVCFKLQDIIDLRKNFWVPRRVENMPKTIDKIHQPNNLQYISLPDRRGKRKTSGLFHKILDMLYDEDVIKEEIFKARESGANEIKDKEAAFKYVKSFFKWLRETELETDG